MRHFSSESHVFQLFFCLFFYFFLLTSSSWILFSLLILFGFVWSCFVLLYFLFLFYLLLLFKDHCHGYICIDWRRCFFIVVGVLCRCCCCSILYHFLGWFFFFLTLTSNLRIIKFLSSGSKKGKLSFHLVVFCTLHHGMAMLSVSTNVGDIK